MTRPKGKKCVFSSLNGFCSHRRIKRVYNKGKQWTNGRTKKRTECPFKDKAECLWFRECARDTWRKWSDPSLLQNARKGLSSSVQ